MASIGEPKRVIEVIPLEEPVSIPVPEPQPEPTHDPEEVPA